LPTDPKLDRLSDAQASILFHFWAQYDEKAIREAWHERRQKPQFDEAELRALGYSESEIADIKRSFR